MFLVALCAEALRFVNGREYKYKPSILPVYLDTVLGTQPDTWGTKQRFLSGVGAFVYDLSGRILNVHLTWPDELQGFKPLGYIRLLKIMLRLISLVLLIDKQIGSNV